MYLKIELHELNSCIREWDRNDIFAKFISSSHPNSHIIVS
ncbi:hypothetical protein BDH17TP_14940 [Staphylococcus aureus]|nr:hypothetical protein BDH17TP_14940 [Staphylococcus aureus]